jgi:alanyl-tRNA synthetase
LRYVQELRGSTSELARQLGTTPAALPERVDKLLSELKAAQKEAFQLRDKLAAAQAGRAGELKEAAGFRYSTALLEGLDAPALRNAADSLMQKLQADIVVVASGTTLVAKVAAAAQTRGAHAGNLIREVAKRAGGSGGGRPDMAQAGVKESSRLAAALAALPELLAAGEATR